MRLGSRTGTQSQQTVRHFKTERLANGYRQQVMLSSTSCQFFLAAQFKLCVCMCMYIGQTQ
jgi:hypothetical protein